MDHSLSIGEKIKAFRTQKKMSQSQLETEAELSFGTISRIEKGVINPTKETLIKIIQTLNLTGYQSASLFNVDPTNLVEAYADIAKSLDLEDILQKSVNNIRHELNLLGGIIFLVKGNRVYAQTFTETWFTELARKIIGRPFNNLSLPLTEEANYVVKTINNKKIYVTHKLSDSAVPPLSKRTSDLLQKLTKHSSSICFPMLDSDKAIGAIYFTKDHRDDFENERSILQSFTNYVTQCVINAQRYKQMQIEVEKLQKSKLKTKNK